MTDREIQRYVRFSASSSMPIEPIESRGASSLPSSISIPPPRWETYQGQSHLVIPVVALLGDIAIYPMGAKCYELVPSHILASAPSSWNNSPVLADHPNDGESGACTPEILSRDQFGYVFNARYDDDSQSLQMEAWLNPTRALAVGRDAIDVFDRCAAGEVLEISIGAYIRLIPAEGVARNGKKYQLAWTLIHPDHLAIGLRGKEGACSVDTGCGANRALKNADGTFKYSSSQVNLPQSIADEIIALGKSIPDDQIAESEGGRETTPHVTVKYGLHDESADNLIELLRRERIGPISLTLGDLAVFEAISYDVLYVGVVSPDLVRLNGLITDNLTVTNTQPEYIPHATVAYIVKGSGANYIGNSILAGKQAQISEIIFSSTDGPTTTIPLPVSDKEAVMSSAQANDATKLAKRSPLMTQVSQLMKSIRSLMSTTDQAHEAAELIGYELMKSMSGSVKSTMTEIDTLLDFLISEEMTNPTETLDDQIAENIMEDARLQAIRSHCFVAYSTIGAILDQAGMLRGDYYGYSAGESKTADVADDGTVIPRANAGKRNSATDQATIQKVHDHSVSLGASCSSDNMPKNLSSPDQKSPCGCGKISNATEGQKEDDMAVTKDEMKALLGRLLSGKGTPEDATLIKTEWGVDVTQAQAQQGQAQAQPQVVQAAQAAPKEKTPEELEVEFLAHAPASVRSLVERAKQAEAETRSTMIRQLTGAQTHYNEAALNGMSTDLLTGMVKMLKLDVPQASRVNFAGLGLPNSGGIEDDAHALQVYGSPPSGIAEYAAAANGVKAN